MDVGTQTTRKPKSLIRKIIALAAFVAASSLVGRSFQLAPLLFEIERTLKQPFSGDITKDVMISAVRSIGGGEGISACLIIMDDNHFLIEWLAYHFYYLPLRRLIVAVDPHSKTSPQRILNRYHSLGLINVTIWGDEDFFPASRKKAYGTNQAKLHVIRQDYFILECLKALYRENRTWVTHIDTDEFIVPNRYASPVYNFTNSSKVYSLLSDPPNEHWRKVTKNETPCHPMIRLDVGIKESTAYAVQTGIPNELFNGSQFLTYRYGYPQSISTPRKPGKAFVDLSRIPYKELQLGNTNPHRPVKSQCTQADAFPPVGTSPFSVYHYAGTFEQFSYRVDGRTSRSREMYDKRYFHTKYEDSAKFWLPGFLQEVGLPLARILLEGVGELEPLPLHDNVSTKVASLERRNNQAYTPAGQWLRS